MALDEIRPRASLALSIKCIRNWRGYKP